MIYLPLAILAAMAALSLIGAARVTGERIPMQWGSNGKPTWYAPRAVGMWFPLGTGLVILAYLAAFLPEREFILAAVLSLSTLLGAQLLYLFLLLRWQSRSKIG